MRGFVGRRLGRFGPYPAPGPGPHEPLVPMGPGLRGAFGPGTCIQGSVRFGCGARAGTRGRAPWAASAAS
jgi:hypothetical protein